MLSAVMMGLTGPFVAVIARDKLHASEFEMGVIAMSPVAGNLFSLVWARMMEGKRKKPFAIAAWITARAMFFLALFATTSPVFVAIVAGINIIVSIAGPAYSALMKEIYPDGDRARIMGYARVCTWSVSIVITALAAWLLGAVSYRYVFPVAAVFGIASALVFNRIPSEDTSGDASIGHFRFMGDSLMILREDPGFRWFCAGIFVFGFANFMAAPIYAIYQVDVLGVKTGWAGIYSIVMQIATMVSYLYWGSYVDRRKPEKVIAIQALAWASIPFMYVAASHPWMLLPAMLVSGIIGAGLDLSYFSGVLHFAPAERITQYQALFAALMGLRGIIAPYVGTTLVQRDILSMKGVFVVSGLLILASVVVQLVGSRRYSVLKAIAG